jgi:hypothetical protein
MALREEAALIFLTPLTLIAQTFLLGGVYSSMVSL